MDYATLESREATFAPPSKRSKTGGWPHKNPKAADLAKAGFYYKPSAQSNDNAVCFLCSRNLDGWEQDDDPVQEHLKHAEDCGWAVLMSVEAEGQYDATNMEDPTGQHISDARRATFAIGWPHESKRGWTCKSEKMIEAGWHFAPTPDSEDYVSCAYCKLSLDGWEPKDNPFDEHYSRSPSCPFFVFAGTTAPSKRLKAKKGRPSKASRTSKASARLSTQSNMTVQSEESSMPDLDESIDAVDASIMSTASTTTTKGRPKRKATAGRAKTTKAKKPKTTKPRKVVDAIEPEEIVIEEPITYPSIEQSQQETAHTQLSQPEETQEQTEPTQQREEAPRVFSPVESLGPPEREASVIHVLAASPVPLVSTAARRDADLPTVSAQNGQAQAEKSVALLKAPHSPPSPTSDIENAPPSTRPKSVRPPIPSSPGGTVPSRWSAVDVDMVFGSIIESNLSHGGNNTATLTDVERQMTVQDWVRHIAGQAEEDLRMEGERVVSIFEMEGKKALNVLEGIVCI